MSKSDFKQQITTAKTEGLRMRHLGFGYFRRLQLLLNEHQNKCAPDLIVFLTIAYSVTLDYFEIAGGQYIRINETGRSINSILTCHKAAYGHIVVNEENENYFWQFQIIKAFNVMIGIDTKRNASNKEFFNQGDIMNFGYCGLNGYKYIGNSIDSKYTGYESREYGVPFGDGNIVCMYLDKTHKSSNKIKWVLSYSVTTSARSKHMKHSMKKTPAFEFNADCDFFMAVGLWNNMDCVTLLDFRMNNE